jgi:hypothetical protein
VPPRAAPYVPVGAIGCIVEIDDPYLRANAEEIGLTMVQLGTFQFWWLEDDLGMQQ